MRRNQLLADISVTSRTVLQSVVSDASRVSDSVSAQSVIAGFTESSLHVVYLTGGHSHVAYEVHNFIHGGMTYGYICTIDA